jgi:hypothetical protein
VECERLFGAYKTWCEANEHAKVTQQTFGRIARRRPVRPQDQATQRKNAPTSTSEQGFDSSHTQGSRALVLTVLRPKHCFSTRGLACATTMRVC